jgi:acyl carrier protein
MDESLIRQRIKTLLIESARLTLTPDEIDDHEPLFGGRLGLDSLDALQLAVVIEEHLGVTLPDDAEGRRCFRSIATLASFVAGKPSHQEMAEVASGHTTP